MKEVIKKHSCKHQWDYLHATLTGRIPLHRLGIVKNAAMRRDIVHTEALPVVQRFACCEGAENSLRESGEWPVR